MSEESPSRVNYRGEIKCMMYCFGDVKSPIVESVSLVEDLTQSQVSEIVVKAAEVAHLRGGTCIIVEDILFLLRKNLEKLKIVLQHIQHLDKSKSARSANSTVNGEDVDLIVPVQEKKSKYSLDFLSPRDRTIVDSEEKTKTVLQRLEAMDRITANMDTSEYFYYSSCRQVNFHKNPSKLSAWLEIDSLVDLKLKQDALEMVGLVALETAREITELALQVKIDMEATGLRAPHNRKYHHQPSLPTATPASSPTTPADISRDTELQRLDSSGSTPAAVGQVEQQQEDGGRVDLRKTKTKGKPKALQPRHIREAFRRYEYTHQGPLTLLTTHFIGNQFYRHNLCT